MLNGCDIELVGSVARSLIGEMGPEFGQGVTVRSVMQRATLMGEVVVSMWHSCLLQWCMKLETATALFHGSSSSCLVVLENLHDSISESVHSAWS